MTPTPRYFWRELTEDGLLRIPPTYMANHYAEAVNGYTGWFETRIEAMAALTAYWGEALFPVDLVLVEEFRPAAS